MPYFTQNTIDFGNGSDEIARSSAGKFPNPFCDIASMYVPQSLFEAFAFCEFLFMTMVPFSSVVNRVVSYFLTSIDFGEVDDDVHDDYDDVFTNRLRIMAVLQEVGRDYYCYGNAFVSVLFPFNRFLECPRCHTRFHISTLSYSFDPGRCEFLAECPKCREGESRMEVVDVPDRGNTEKVVVKRWNPKRMRLRVNPVSNRVAYYYDLEENFVENVRQGKRFYIDDTPMEILRTCCRGQSGENAGNRLFRFKESAIFHMRDEPLAGLDIRGWGIPPLLPYFKLAYYIQLMRRYDEAIALDFIVPFRVLFPNFNGPQAQDGLTTVSMQRFISAVQNMVQKKRLNITTYDVSPFPLGYQMIGGEAKQLSPKESVQEAMTELLSAMGFPQELFSGTLTLQAAPVALRLFERQFNVLVDGDNQLLQWLADKVAAFYGWDEVDVMLNPVTLADDLERKGMQLQAAAGMDVSKQTAYKAMGIDYLDEQGKILQEQKEIQDMQTKAMLDQQAETENGEGNAPGAGNNPATTPGDVYTAAQETAQEMLQMTGIQRRQALARLKQTNPTMHATVLEMLREARQDMASQGRAMIQQQNNMPM